MTTEEWKKVEENLQLVCGSGVKLLVDGYEVSLYLRQVSQFKNAIVFYINGKFHGKWLVEDCEERRRFFPCKKRCITNTNELKKMGICSKKEIQKYKEAATYNEYSYGWTNFNAMKKHFEANNTNIEILNLSEE